MWLGYQDKKIKFYTKSPLNIKFYNLDKIEETENEYVLENDEYVLKDTDWNERQARLEQENVKKLKLTRADVERGIYMALGVDFNDVIDLLRKNYNEVLDIKALQIELNANNFYRGNPYVSKVGAILGFSEEQLDKFFLNNDYKELLQKVGD